MDENTNQDQMQTPPEVIDLNEPTTAPKVEKKNVAKPIATPMIWLECRIDDTIDFKVVENIVREIGKSEIPNGKVHEEYQYVRNFDRERAFRRVRLVSARCEGLKTLGLKIAQSVKGNEFRIVGTPTRAYEGSIKIAVRFEFDTTALVDGQRVRICATIPNYAREFPFVVNPDPWDLWEEKEPSPAEPYPKEHGASYCALLRTTPRLKLLAARRRGRSHAQNAKFCDDHFVVDPAKTPDDWTIVAVADGAGSAKYSRKGSELACEYAVKVMRQGLRDKLHFDTLLLEWIGRNDAKREYRKDETKEVVPTPENVVLTSEAPKTDDPQNQELQVTQSKQDKEQPADCPDFYTEDGVDANSQNETTPYESSDTYSDSESSKEIHNQSDEDFLNVALADESVSEPTPKESPEESSEPAPNEAEPANVTEVAQPAEVKNSPQLTPEQELLQNSKLSGIIYAAVWNAWNAIETERKKFDEKERPTANDFNTTMLLAAIKRLNATDSSPAAWVVVSYWVGDGALAIYRPDGQDDVLTLGTPDGGEFAGQTRFLTTKGEVDPKKVLERSHVVFLKDFDALALMTDGVSDPFFPAECDFKSYTRWNEFMNGDMAEHFPGVMDRQKSLEEREKALLDGLMFKISGNHDDRTLLLILSEGVFMGKKVEFAEPPLGEAHSVDAPDKENKNTDNTENSDKDNGAA